MIPGKQYRPEDFLVMAWRRKWWIAVPFVIATAGAIFGARLLPNKYRSETTIMVVPQRIPESYVQSTVTARIEDRLQSISQQIRSRPKLESIIDEFGLYQELRRMATMDDVVERMNDEIDVQVVKGDAFRVAYIADDPHTAMRVADRLASMFISENLKDRGALADATNQFLEAQLEDARNRLVDYEKKVSDYERAHSDELPAQLVFNQQAQHNAEMQVQTLVNSIAADRDRRLVLERQITDLTAPGNEATATPLTRPTGGDGSTEPTAVQQLASARTNLATLEARLKPEHPDVVRAKRLIAELEKKAAAEAESGPGAAPAPSPAQAARDSRIRDLRTEVGTLGRQIAAKEQEEGRLRAVIATYQGRIQAAPLRASELAALTRDYDTLQQMYRNLLQKKEDSKMAASLEKRQVGEQFKVLDPPNLPERPFSPNRLRIYVLGSLLGLALGVGLAALLEYLDASMRSEEDVRIALGLPVIALVPFEKVQSKDQRRRRLLLTLTGAVTIGLSLVAFAWRIKA